MIYDRSPNLLVKVKSDSLKLYRKKNRYLLGILEILYSMVIICCSVTMMQEC
ncbi:hypothetical protein HanIR_Chr07g0334841 [Helianthus annuus]|nr:hypothetical protein HanIR_Chr07g0334841 [Helianthus annuus]